MEKIGKQLKRMMLLLGLAVGFAGCSDDDGGSSSNTSSNLLPNFHQTPENEIEARIKELKRLFPFFSEQLFRTAKFRSMCFLPGSDEALWKDLGRCQYALREVLQFR